MAHQTPLQLNKPDAEALLLGFIAIVYAQCPTSAFDHFARVWEATHPDFVSYLRVQWMGNVKHWARVYAHPNNQGKCLLPFLLFSCRSN